jgi:hypothetical protein
MLECLFGITVRQLSDDRDTEHVFAGSISHEESLGQMGSSSHAYTPPDNFFGKESGASQPLGSVEPRQRSLSAEFDGMSFAPWLEQSQALGLAGDSLFPGTSL